MYYQSEVCVKITCSIWYIPRDKAVRLFAQHGCGPKRYIFVRQKYGMYLECWFKNCLYEHQHTNTQTNTHTRNWAELLSPQFDTLTYKTYNQNVVQPLKFGNGIDKYFHPRPYLACDNLYMLIQVSRMGPAMVSQITGVSIVYSTVCSGAVNSPHKGQ